MKGRGGRGEERLKGRAHGAGVSRGMREASHTQHRVQSISDVILLCDMYVCSEGLITPSSQRVGSSWTNIRCIPHMLGVVLYVCILLYVYVVICTLLCSFVVL